MKRSILAIFVFSAVLATGISALDFTLSDGTILNGELKGVLEFETAYGVLSLEGQSIETLTIGQQKSQLTLVSGDKLVGKIKNKQFEVILKFGTAMIDSTSIVAITRSAATNLPPAGNQPSPRTEKPNALLEMVLVPGGSFMMGSDSGGSDERPMHKVNLSSFYIGKYEVTQGQYRSVSGSNPSYFPAGNDADSRPVEQVTWFDAVSFCNLLSEREGFSKVYTINGSSVSADYSRNGYRLPTEAEWEYAARGGNGNPGGYTYSGSNEPGSVAWYNSNSGGTTHAVGTKAGNGLGLYDMSGNVWEWCQDWYGSYGSSAQTDPMGAASGVGRVFRGGSWYFSAEALRSASRGGGGPGGGGDILGFRVLRRP